MRDAVEDITAGAHNNSNDGSTPSGGGEADRLGPDIWKITAVAVAGSPFNAALKSSSARSISIFSSVIRREMRSALSNAAGGSVRHHVNGDISSALKGHRRLVPKNGARRLPVKSD